MLKLSADNFFCSGGNRDIYYYNNKKKTIKITKIDVLQKRKNKTNFLKKIRPLKYFDENFEDLLFFKHTKDKNINFIPKYYGIVKTNLGYGTVFENILNYNNTQAMNLEEFMIKNFIKNYDSHNNNNNEEFLNKIKAAFYDLFFNMLENNFICRELKDFNLVVKINENNNYKLYIIDGFGNSEFIPISSYIKPIAKNKIIRQFIRFKNFMHKKYEKINNLIKLKKYNEINLSIFKKNSMVKQK